MSLQTQPLNILNSINKQNTTFNKPIHSITQSPLILSITLLHPTRLINLLTTNTLIHPTNYTLHLLIQANLPITNLLPTHSTSFISHSLIQETLTMKQNSNVYLTTYSSKNIQSLTSQKLKSKNPQKNTSPTITPLSIGVQLTPARLELLLLSTPLYLNTTSRQNPIMVMLYHYSLISNHPLPYV